MSIYQYQPLPVNHIRLIQLLPNADDGAALRCKLHNYPILGRKIGCHLYDALSYVWGPPPNTREIEILEGPNLRLTLSVLLIRENCYAALVRLRDPILPRFLWVDSICINQEDNKEKTLQVRIMTKIYALASRVIVWLRDPGQGRLRRESRGLEIVRRAAYNQTQGDMTTGFTLPHELTSDEADEIIAVLKREWFRRIWVLQEVAAARQVIVMDELHEVDGLALASGLDALVAESTRMRFAGERAAEKLEKTMGLARMALTLIRGANSRSRMLSTKDISSERFTLSVHPLSTLVDLFHDHNATDRRDKIFALLGMGSDVPSGISANYGLPWCQVFRELASSLFGGNESATATHIETWDDQEIADIKTKVLVVGIVTTSSSSGDSNGVQRRQVQWVAKEDDILLGRNLSSSAAASIHANDLVCLFPGARSPSIVRPISEGTPVPYFIVIATAINTGGGNDLNRTKVPTWVKKSAHVAENQSMWVACRVVWDWGIPREHTTRQMPYESQRTTLHLELMAKSRLIWSPPESFQDRISTLDDFGEVLARAGSTDSARAVFNTLIDLHWGATEWNSPGLVVLEARIRRHGEFLWPGYEESLWKIEAITRTGRAREVSGLTLMSLPAVHGAHGSQGSGRTPESGLYEYQQLKDWCKYRSEDVRHSITPPILGNLVRRPERSTIDVLDWVLDCLRPDDAHVVQQFLADDLCYDRFFITADDVDFQAALYLKWKMECIAGSVDPVTLHHFKTLKESTEDVFDQASLLNLQQLEFIMFSLRDLIPAPQKQQLFTKAVCWGERAGARKQMGLILDCWGDDITITERVLLEAVNVALQAGSILEDRFDNELVLNLLTERRGNANEAGQPLTAHVLLEFAPKISSPSLVLAFKQLLSLFDNPQVRSSGFLNPVDVNGLIIAATTNTLYGNELVKIILSKYIDRPVIGPDAMRRAWVTSEESRKAMFGLLEERIGTGWVEKVNELREKWIRGEKHGEEVISGLITYAMSRFAAEKTSDGNRDGMDNISPATSMYLPQV